MIRKETMKDSMVWQNIGEVAVQTSNLALSVHSYTLLRPDMRFPAGVFAAFPL